jgi:hypothetical protein
MAKWLRLDRNMRAAVGREVAHAIEDGRVLDAMIRDGTLDRIESEAADDEGEYGRRVMDEIEMRVARRRDGPAGSSAGRVNPPNHAAIRANPVFCRF